MSYEEALNRALKYGLSTDEEVRPFLKAHQEGDKDALPVLADYLQDRDDPRAEILRRHLGQSQHPNGLKANDYVGGVAPDEDLFSGRNHLEFSNGSPSDPTGQNRLTFSPFRKDGIKSLFTRRPTDLVVSWSHSHSPVGRYLTGLSPATHSHFEAAMTPDEVRKLAEHLPEEQAGVLHRFLDSHFGKRS